MINRSNLSDNDKEVLAVFDGLPPFTITVTQPEDALFLAEGLFLKLGCPPELMAETLQTMTDCVKHTGSVEEGVALFFDSGTERGFYYPAFMRGIFVHLFNHVTEKNK